MSLKIQDSGGTSRTISKLSIKDNGGVVRVLQKLRIKDETGTLRTVFSSLTAAAAPTTISSSIATPYPSNATTDAATATPTGGVGPFTYLWSITEALDAPWTIDTPTAATTTMTCPFLAPGAFASATMECVVTDSVMSTAATNSVAASALNTG